MKPFKTLGILLLILSPLFAAGCAGVTASASDNEVIEASGTIEAEEVIVASELGGLVVEVLADEGDDVEEGQVLVRLDDTVARSQLMEAEAALRAAQAELAKLEKGARAEEIEAARAALAQAKAQRDGAKRAWEDALKALEAKQELELEIQKARAEITKAEGEIKKAEVQLRMAQIMRDRYQGDGSTEGKTFYQVYSHQVEAAQAAIEAAKARKKAAEQALADLLDKKVNPYELVLRAHQAETEYHQAEAAVLAAQAELDKLLAGARPEEIEVAKAAVEQAEAAVEAARIQLDKHIIRAPASGFVSTRSVEPGENIQPGATLMTISYLDEVELTLYVPLTKLGLVKLGQSVEVTVDAYPGEVFRGYVVYISPEAEFTPKSVQTKEERVSLVFAVKVKLPNPEHKLKPGMPADAVIRVK
ncbi:MAG TPA: HlyD family efflux transporter periplasmic adaptor subunit [Chloroflexi bacterium]|nr:HlyD family efflux transporter periplasmic adaptor subunit [Chloroflexota bacterium]